VDAAVLALALAYSPKHCSWSIWGLFIIRTAANICQC